MRLMTVKQLSEDQPALTEPAIRFDLFNRRTNGLQKAGAVIQRGRRVLIDRDAYLDWMASRGKV